jgi:uncharacterized membrane protein YkoI
MNIKKTAITTAVTLGTLAGSFTLASALTPADTAPPASAAEQTTPDDATGVPDPDLGGSIIAPEVDGVTEAAEAAGLEGLTTVTAEEATGAALAAQPGATLVDVSLGNENGTVVYEVTVMDAAGTTVEVKVDAGNAAVLDQQSGDNEAEQGSDAEEAGESEDVSDEADDGIDHEFEGEETGENGDGVADADDASEAQEATNGN